MIKKRFIEIWEELEDVLFIENEESELILESNWYNFESGTSNEAIWASLENRFPGLIIGEVLGLSAENIPEHYANIRSIA